MADKIESLSLKDLRALVKEAGLSSEDCIEKAQLRARAAEAVERLLLPGAKLGPVGKTLGLTATAAAPSASGGSGAAGLAELGDKLLTKEGEVPLNFAPLSAVQRARARGSSQPPTWPPTAPEAHPLAQGCPLGPRGRTSAPASKREPAAALWCLPVVADRHRLHPSRLGGKKLVMLYFSAHWRGNLLKSAALVVYRSSRLVSCLLGPTDSPAAWPRVAPGTGR